MNDIQLPETETPRPAGPPGNAVVHNRLRYHGTAGDFAKIALTNAIASIATLGIYRFWGKTRERRYLWGGIEFLGDRVEYAGIGRELFLGFLVALAVLGLLLGMAYGIPLVFGDALWVQWLVQFVYTFVLIVLIYVAEYRARRYRLSRTQWRGIRFAQDGSSLRYALLALGWGIVVVLSLGSAYAVYRTRVQHYRTTHTSFGDRRFGFDARAVELLKPWLLAWILWLPSLGLSHVWYRVKEFRYFAERSRCGSSMFRSDLRSPPVILYIGAHFAGFLCVVAGLFAVIIALTSGSLFPREAAVSESTEWMLSNGSELAAMVVFVVMFVIAVPILKVLQTLLLVHPLFRLVFGSISVIGQDDFATIAQSRQAAPRRGEGLADALDVGAV